MPMPRCPNCQHVVTIADIQNECCPFCDENLSESPSEEPPRENKGEGTAEIPEIIIEEPCCNTCGYIFSTEDEKAATTACPDCGDDPNEGESYAKRLQKKRDIAEMRKRAHGATATQ